MLLAFALAFVSVGIARAQECSPVYSLSVTPQHIGSISKHGPGQYMLSFDSGAKCIEAGRAPVLEWVHSAEPGEKMYVSREGDQMVVYIHSNDPPPDSLRSKLFEK
jgi:hypothetical protein